MIRDNIAEIYGEDNELLFLAPSDFDEAIIGVMEGSRRGSIAIAYDYEKVIDILMRQGMDREEADEFYSFNILGTYVGEYTPVFIDRRCTHE